MKHFMLVPVFLIMSACATASAPYGPATSSSAQGYTVQPIESNRLQVSYKAKDAETARTFALRRAAEVTLERNAEWFRVTNAYDDREADTGRTGGSSISIGGASGSRGRSSVGVGLGIGIPLGGGASGDVTHMLEIITGSGVKPSHAAIYDARSVLENIQL